jgi:hypothetical protein
MPESPPELDLRDIPDASSFLPTSSPAWWVWLLLGIILTLLAWLLLRKKTSSSTTTTQDSYRDACLALDQASTIATPITLATTVSLIIRRYLAATLADPSLFETHEEFLARHSAIQTLPENMRAEISRHFALIARLKYAPRADSQVPTSLIPDIRGLLDRLHALSHASAPAR